MMPSPPIDDRIDTRPSGRLPSRYPTTGPKKNLNPVGRLYYNASTMICVPTSLDQEVGEGLGAQAGELKINEVAASGGFTCFRRATQGPFNMVIEARP